MKISVCIKTFETIETLQKIFHANKGDGQIFLRQGGSWTKIAQRIAYGPELCDALKNLLGDENFRLY